MPTYIDRINHFWNVHEEHDFSTNEIALFFYLAQVNNRLHWKESFKRNNLKVCADLGFADRRTLNTARDSLKVAGLIDFQKSGSNPNVTYTLCSAFFAGQSVQQPVEATAQPTVEVIDTKERQDNTKLEKSLSLLSETNLSNGCNSILDEYNKQCISMPKVTRLTSARKKAIIARTKENGWEAVQLMITNASKSPHLNGHNDRGWRANFDWLFQPNNFIKVLEGNYLKQRSHEYRTNSTSNGSNATNRQTSVINSIVAELEEIDRSSN